MIGFKYLKYFKGNFENKLNIISVINNKNMLSLQLVILLY